jgi:hypothetical protein
MSFGFKGLNSVNQLIVVKVKCGVLFEVRTEFLNIIKMSFGYRGLKGKEFLLLTQHNRILQITAWITSLVIIIWLLLIFDVL